MTVLLAPLDTTVKDQTLHNQLVNVKEDFIAISFQEDKKEATQKLKTLHRRDTMLQRAPQFKLNVHQGLIQQTLSKKNVPIVKKENIVQLLSLQCLSIVLKGSIVPVKSSKM